MAEANTEKPAAGIPAAPANPIAQRVTYVNFADVIDDKRAKSLMAVCTDLLNRDKPDVLYLLMSSPGGSVDLGITLFNYLRALPCILITHNTGSIESIGNVVFLAGEIRLAAPHCRFLLHGIFWQPPGGQTIATPQLSEIASRFRDDEVRVKNILLERTRLQAKDIDAFFKIGESKNAAYAIDVGIIHEIQEPKIAPGSGLFSCNFQ